MLTFRSCRVFSTARRALADPWPLPGSPGHIASSTSNPDLPRPIPVPRHNESIDTLRVRLLYQARKRGTLESDLLLSTFANDNLDLLTGSELRELDKVSSGDLLDYIISFTTIAP
jgi:succinate dehydrogenase assembly factor 2